MKKYSTVYMYHNFFIHSSVNGYLGCFYVLAIVNSSAKNIGIHVSFSIMVSREDDGNPLQYSCLENPMDRGAGWATVHGVAKSQTQLSMCVYVCVCVCVCVYIYIYICKIVSHLILKTSNRIIPVL